MGTYLCPECGGPTEPKTKIHFETIENRIEKRKEQEKKAITSWSSVAVNTMVNTAMKGAIEQEAVIEERRRVALLGGKSEIAYAGKHLLLPADHAWGS
jgi:hypothetical protein